MYPRPTTRSCCVETLSAGEAFVPGLYSFLGGSGMFLSAVASREQQDYGWELLKGMYEKASAFALVQRSPPPFEVRTTTYDAFFLGGGGYGVGGGMFVFWCSVADT